MEKVTKEKFYAEIREKKLDLCVYPIGDKYPYITNFKFRDGVLWGVVKPTERDSKKYPNYPWYEEEYFINR